MHGFPEINLFSDFIAAAIYFGVGGLWFSPYGFQTLWDRSIGFNRPSNWKPTARYFAAPFLGCLVITIATDVLVGAIHAQTLADAIILGLTVGIGYAAAVAGIMSVAPTTPKPALLAAVVGSYHAVGLVLVATIVFTARQIHLT